MALLAGDVARILSEQATWVDWDASVDSFKAGSPDLPVTGIAVGWQSLQSSLEQAHALGCNLFITHEPTFYDHRDRDPDALQSPPAQAKRAWLESTGMAVYRCHDVWDQFPEIGIPDAWAVFLGFGPVIAQDTYHRVIQMPRVTAWELVTMVMERVRTLGEQAVLFAGAKDQLVSRLGIGTGAITDVRTMLRLGADAILATDDGISQWREGAYLLDAGVPLLTVNHATAEAPGMQTMAQFLRERLPGVPVHLVGRTCTFEILSHQQSNEENVFMVRPTLDDLPPLTLPVGYTHRPMAADEMWAYLEVMNGSCFNGGASEAWFHNTYPVPPFEPSFIQLIWHGDRPVAGACAWQTDDGQAGIVHWVGVARNERHRGLGKAITLAVLHRLRERGFGKALLGTQSWRKQAIAAYLRLGFEPDTTNRPEDREVWQNILAELDEWRLANGTPTES